MRPGNIVQDGSAGDRDEHGGAVDAPGKSSRRKSGKSPVSQTHNSENSAVGTVLKSVYQKAVDEAIPAEMLDLLSKLD
ncbi:MAG TPA: NepR family anti-sigma factor [Sphingobium sp.]